MDFRKLEYFIAAVECGSFTKAAQQCFISQTAMSQQIAAMEQELDLLLFDRSSYRPTLTPSGKAFYESSKTLVEIYEKGLEKASALKNKTTGSLKIGISGPIEKRFLPEILVSESSRRKSGMAKLILCLDWPVKLPFIPKLN
jgi:DNA-binding transcriptional LysR family regulator